MKTNKNVIALSAIGGLVIAIVVLYFPAYLWFLPYLHDRTLNGFSQPFMSIPLPAQTQEIDHLAVVGQQSGGNINECDYLAAFLLKTNLPKPQLQSHYATHYLGKSKVQFYWLDEPHGSNIGAVNPSGIPTLNSWVNETSSANVIVFIMEPALTSSIDPRCSGPFGL